MIRASKLWTHFASIEIVVTHGPNETGQVDPQSLAVQSDDVLIDGPLSITGK